MNKKIIRITSVWVVFICAVIVGKQQLVDNGLQSKPLVSSSTNVPAADAFNLRIVSINVHNLFNGVVEPNNQVNFAKSRGARTTRHYEQQKNAVLQGLTALDADVFGLIEVENDLHQANPVIQDLVDGLNQYFDNKRSYQIAGVNAAQRIFGSDQITQFIIYDQLKLNPVGPLRSEFTGGSNARNRRYLGRPTLMQGFETVPESHSDTPEKQQFYVAVSHLKSKRGGCPQDKTSQSPCNSRRQLQVEEYTAWISQHIGSNGIIWLGDFNAMPHESPVQWILAQGYQSPLNLKSDYSYIYRGHQQLIDYALIKNMNIATVNARIWHVNTRSGDERYQQQADFPNIRPAMRSFSDHDAVVLDL